MHDYENAAIRALENNIQRYTRLLRTKLTPLEQKFLKRRLIEDRLELRRLRASIEKSRHIRHTIGIGLREARA